jgi:hypothetical protein
MGFFMHDLPRQMLCELIVEYGRSLCDDPRRCEALLKDYCGHCKPEVFVLIHALKNRVASDLLHIADGVPPAIALTRLSKRLEDDLAITPEAAHWAVESWALALKVVGSPERPLRPMLPPAAIAWRDMETSDDRSAGSASPPTTSDVASDLLLTDRYLDNQDGTVTDVETGLQWSRCALGQNWQNGLAHGEAQRYPWDRALEAVGQLNRQGGYAGYHNWRMPSKEELLTLVYCSNGRFRTWNHVGDGCRERDKRPTIYQPAFPNTPCWAFWSASTYVSNPGYAWYVSFKHGLVDRISKSYAYHVRLVR